MVKRNELSPEMYRRLQGFQPRFALILVAEADRVNLLLVENAKQLKSFKRLHLYRYCLEIILRNYVTWLPKSRKVNSVKESTFHATLL